MFLMELSDVLEMPSGDAFAFWYCSSCGYSWRKRNRQGQIVTRTCGCVDALTLNCETVGQIIGAKRGDPQFWPLVESIAENGKQTPALVSGGEMLNGHHGIAALVELGWSEIPLTESYVEYLSSEESADWDEGNPDLGY